MHRLKQCLGPGSSPHRNRMMSVHISKGKQRGSSVLDQIAHLFSEDVVRDVNINDDDRHTFVQRDIDNR